MCLAGEALQYIDAQRPVEFKWKLKAPKQDSAWSRGHPESSDQFDG